MFSSLLRPLSRRLITLSVCGRSLANYLPSMATGKLVNDRFKELVTPELLQLESLFKSNGYDFRLVGGVVRDLLLGNSPKDVDISTDCTPVEMIKLFEAQGIRYIPTGLQHGTITVHLPSGIDYEVCKGRFNLNNRVPRVGLSLLSSNCPRWLDVPLFAYEKERKLKLGNKATCNG